MKLEEIIELNGKEYTVELNRESVLRIDKYVNIQKSSEIINKVITGDKSEMEIPNDEDPFAEPINEEEYKKALEEKQKTLEKLIIRSFWIWLYPKNKLNVEQVTELIKPYLTDDDKAPYLVKKYEEFINKSVEIRKKAEDDVKNLKALTN